MSNMWTRRKLIFFNGNYRINNCFIDSVFFFRFQENDRHNVAAVCHKTQHEVKLKCDATVIPRKSMNRTLPFFFVS